MNSRKLWNLFIATGSISAYLNYLEALRQEKGNDAVGECQGG